MYLSVTYCQFCLDKRDLTEEEKDADICLSLSVSSEEYMCLYDESTNSCVEKGCEELSVKQCRDFNYLNDENNRPKRCIEKDDKSGCRLIYCEDLNRECERFFSGFAQYSCVINSEGNQCQLKECSEQPISNCSEFFSLSSFI